jgi:hypothetical protein
MPRGTRNRAACAAVALLLACTVRGAFSRITEENLDRARGSKTDAHVMRLGKRVVDVDAEIEAELAGRPPVVRGKAPSVPHRSLLETGDTSGDTAGADVRWRLLDDAGDSREPSDPDAPRWGDGSGDVVTQFLVATDGARGAFDAVAAAVEAHGGGVAGIIPPTSYVAVGGPAAAAAARDLAVTLWVGLLAPEDIVTGGLDTAEAVERTTLGEDGRALLEVSVPSLFVSDDGDADSSRPRRRRTQGVPRALAEAMAAAFAATAAAASGDSGAWARPMASWARDGVGVSVDRPDAKVTRVLVGVRPEGLVATARALAAHRAAHLVAPRARIELIPVSSPSDGSPHLPPATDAISLSGSSTGDPITGRALLNAKAIQGLQGKELAGTSTDTPFWDAGITGAGQVVGVGDSGVDRANCYLSGAEKFALVRAWQNDVDENGHGTHVCGSVAGYSANSGADAEGMAYDATMAFTDIGKSDGSVASPESMGDDFYEHARAVGARIHTDSWGADAYNAALDGTSAYYTPTQEVDAYAATNMDFLPMFAIGNAGSSISTYAFPANGKNTLAIGATLSPNTEDCMPYDNDGLYCNSTCAASGRWVTFPPLATAAGARAHGTGRIRAGHRRAGRRALGTHERRNPRDQRGDEGVVARLGGTRVRRRRRDRDEPV